MNCCHFELAILFPGLVMSHLNDSITREWLRVIDSDSLARVIEFLANYLNSRESNSITCLFHIKHIQFKNETFCYFYFKILN